MISPRIPLDVLDVRQKFLGESSEELLEFLEESEEEFLEKYFEAGITGTICRENTGRIV